MTRGFFVGRFQPPHNGHYEVINRIATEVDELVVGIGSADASHTESDPFTGGERVMMVTKLVAEVDLLTYVVPLEDIERNAVWVSHVRSMCPNFDVAYSNNPLVVRLFEEDGLDVRSQPMYDREVNEGTSIRELMVAGEPWRQHVPDPVTTVIEEINGVERLQKVASSDANGS